MCVVKLGSQYKYENMLQDGDELVNNYKGLLQKETIGTSYDKRQIIMFRLGKGDKNILCTGGCHGRESINTVILMKMMEYYCDCYENRQWIGDIPAFELFQKCSIYFIPLLNPDGYMIATEGFHALKSEELRNQAEEKNIPYPEWKYNGRGVDLNRNFPSATWKEKFAGDFQASERETRALIRIFDSITWEGFLDYHSRGRLIYYYKSRMSDEYNQKQKKLADYLKSLSGYVLAPAGDEIKEGDSGGNTVHYFSEHFRKPALTIETVEEDARFPLLPSCQKDVWKEICQTAAGFAWKLCRI